jgi:tetratricopeptide (TPR) repeat protein
MFDSERDSRQEFYISFDKADESWAEWITWQLKSVRISATIPKVDFQAEKHFVQQALPEILRQFRHILVLLSLDYLYALDKQLDWALLLRHEAQKEEGLILPVHVRECKSEIQRLFGDIHYIDLVGLNEAEARFRLFAGVLIDDSQPVSTSFSEDIFKDKKLRKKFRDGLNDLKHREYSLDSTDRHLPNLDDLPFQRNPFFTNREEILEYLEKSLFSDTSVVFYHPMALSGLGGIGKTQIVLEYAHRYKHRYRYIFWVKASSREPLVSGFVSIANQLRLPVRNHRNQDEIVIEVKDWLQTNEQWLLIFDDVEELEVIKDFLPMSSKGHILLTTQIQSMGTIAQHIPVRKLSTRAAATFLLRRIHSINKDGDFELISSGQRDLAKEVAAQMDGLPLALDQAGAYIEKMALNLLEYKDYYAQHLIDILDMRGEPPLSHEASVLATWAISFERLLTTKPIACHLLCFCSFLTVDQIPEEIITSAHELLGPELEPITHSPFELDDTIDELRQFSLIARNPKTRTLHVHGLVQAVIRTALQNEMQDRLPVPGNIKAYVWAQRVIRAVNHVFPDPRYQHWGECERYIAAVIACADLIEQWRADFPDTAGKLEFPETARLLHDAGTYLFDRTQYKEAERLYKLALNMREKVSNSDELATSYNDLGWLHRAMSDYKEARPLFNQALEIREHGSQQALAQTLNDLAWLDYNEGNYFEAQALNQRALSLREAQEDDQAGLATSLNNLAWIHYVLAKYREAQKEYTHALQIRQASDPTHPYTAVVLDNIARLYRKVDRYKEAEQLFLEALEIRRNAFGEKHPDVAHSLNGLGFLYYRLGDYDRAANYYLHALHIHQRTWPSPHPHMTQILTNMARLAYAQGDYKQAQELYQNSLDIREARGESDHPDVAHILSCFARLYRRLADYEKAAQFYQRALEIRRRVFRGMHHPDVAQVLNHLGALRVAEGKYVEAEGLLSQALTIREEILGEDHLDVAQTLTNMTRLHRLLGRYDEAERCANRAYDIWQNILGVQHHYIAIILTQLGEVYQAQGQHFRAQQEYRQALNIQEQKLGRDHPDTARTLGLLAEIDIAFGHYDEARELLKRAITIRNLALGSTHPGVITLQQRLKELVRKKG